MAYSRPKYLKAGIMEDGKFESTEEGSAQGSVMSPMLANIYMHNVLTLWLLESDRNSHPKTSRINQSESDRNSQS